MSLSLTLCSFPQSRKKKISLVSKTVLRSGVGYMSSGYRDVNRESPRQKMPRDSESLLSFLVTVTEMPQR